jgi:hypothetical protein
MKKAVMMLAGAGVIALAGGALAQGGAGSGTAVYWMTADTTSGMAAMMGGGRPSGRAMMGAMFGRGGGMDMNGYAKTLHLQLGGTVRPADPSAEHDPPAGLGAGPSLPLVTPREVQTTEAPSNGMPSNMERPRGRILIYWGCGEHARPGQPVVIDFSTIQAGQIPPAFAAAMNVAREQPPSQGRFPTYGEWPNQKSQARVPQTGSLVGDHVIRGNYSPEIRFTLAQNQDFLAPVTLVSNSAAPSGAVPVMWQPVPGARAWFASAMGGGQSGDMVMWTSSETQAMPMMDYMPDGEIARLIQQHVLMPAPTDRCTVPAEVARAGQGMMYMLTAFGGEANFSHPLRPARPPAGWHPDWLVKLRIKSNYMGLLGMNMPSMGDREQAQDQSGDNPPPGQKKKKKGLMGGIGGLIPHPR